MAKEKRKIQIKLTVKELELLVTALGVLESEEQIPGGPSARQVMVDHLLSGEDFEEGLRSELHLRLFKLAEEA